jgi:hypothetical protein
MAVNAQESLLPAIRAAIDKVVSNLQEEIISAAVKDFEFDLRKRIAQVAVTVADYYSVQRLGPDLVIHVKLDKGQS